MEGVVCTITLVFSYLLDMSGGVLNLYMGVYAAVIGANNYT